MELEATTTDDYTVRDFAKDVAVETVKGVLVTAAGYVLAGAVVAGVAFVSRKVSARKAAKTTIEEDPAKSE